MVNAPEFDSLEVMEASTWLAKTREKMQAGQWPAECVRCQEAEPNSIRQYAIKLDQQPAQTDYLQVGGVLDNVCNAACLMCDEQLSTRIGSLHGRVFPVLNNNQAFWNLPQDRIVHLDINGGEPSYSKNYRYLLENLPPNLRTLRVNTNGSTVITELTDIASRGIAVTVTLSCDGIGTVFELVRWPLTWNNFYKNLMTYRDMPVNLNLWTTVSVLNMDDLVNIQSFAREHSIDHDYAYLKQPDPLAVENRNSPESLSYIRRQKQLRGLE
jgi:hypothetical protein